jgi:hypothetical protein
MAMLTATPLQEAREIRMECLRLLQEKIIEGPRATDWERQYRIAFRAWADSHNTVCFLERSKG